jgi:glycosyltransferase involved in cell wall biosynthesis
MIDEVDLVMWTKNGAETLPLVLKRISEVIPSKIVNKRVIADAHSSDNTREIAKTYGWDVVLNEGKGISDGANTSLKHVKSEYFISFEQDLLLARDWWQRIPKHLSGSKIAIASGVRLPNQPLALRKLQEYATEKYQRKAKECESFLYGKTLDNTIYKTRIVRLLGGFPRLRISAGVDTVLAQRIHSNGFKWKVDYNVRSIHLRKGLKDELAHYYWYGTCANQLEPVLFSKPVNLKSTVLRALFSPFRGLEVAIKKNAPQVIYIYPLIRLAILKGTFDGRKVLQKTEGAA